MRLAEKLRRLEVFPGELAVCWLGQAGFFLKDHQGNTLVIDPYLTNCGEQIRGFKRISPVLMEPEELAPDYYITTHLHFDHFDYDAIPVIAQSTPESLFLGPSSCQEKLLELGVKRRRRLDRGETYQDGAVLIRAVTADHGDMAPDAIGVLLELGGHRIYFSGDTAFHKSLCLEAAGFKPDIAVLSINGRFGNMNAEEGACAAGLCNARYAVPCHFWTFMEHGGDPGAFCQYLRKGGRCQPLCFCQGEVQTINEKNELQYRKETA